MPHGRADAAALEARLAGSDGPARRRSSRSTCSHLDGRSLLALPLVKRREALRRVLRPGDEVVAVPAIATEGRALYDAAVAQGIAGILARQRMSPYLPGVRSRLWRFVAATPGSAVTDDGSPGAQPIAAAPVLALISRLPLGRRGVGRSAQPARRAAAMKVADARALAVEQDARGVHAGRQDRGEDDRQDQDRDRRQRPPRAPPGRP